MQPGHRRHACGRRRDEPRDSGNDNTMGPARDSRRGSFDEHRYRSDIKGPPTAKTTPEVVLGDLTWQCPQRFRLPFVGRTDTTIKIVTRDVHGPNRCCGRGSFRRLL